MSGKIGIRKAGRRAGVNKSAIRRWISWYKNYGETARKYDVSYQQDYTWVKKFSQLGEVGLEDRRGQRTAQQSPWTPEEELKARIAQLEHENYLLKMERDLLKK